MKEIKFRAWDKSAEMMLYPKETIGGETLMINRLKQIWHLGNVIQLHNKNKRFEVMQFTGLKDKNGVEIYEGDIAYSEGHRITFTVEYDMSMAGFMACSDRLMMGIGQNAHVLEVIGNIYENPEPLKEQQT